MDGFRSIILNTMIYLSDIPRLTLGRTEMLPLAEFYSHIMDFELGSEFVCPWQRRGDSGPSIDKTGLKPRRIFRRVPILRAAPLMDVSISGFPEANTNALLEFDIVVRAWCDSTSVEYTTRTFLFRDTGNSTNPAFILSDLCEDAQRLQWPERSPNISPIKNIWSWDADRHHSPAA
ncbi:hypothetical protein TNCV_2763851 [Trichonephila clavipes]|nr:hypothetical protein TNCV_2763851 [Trichonephila clavipes]